MVKKYDVLIIGGGTSGVRAAHDLSAKHKVALFEPDLLGGTCLNRGCIPTKALLHASHLYHQSKNLKELGIDVSPKINFTALMKRVNGIVDSGHEHVVSSIAENKNITLIKEYASFADKKTVKAKSTLYTAKKIIVSTGAKNFVPPIPGLEKVRYISNENILSEKSLPKSIIMIGGGYISMELATFYAELGVQVTVLERGDHILGMLDHDVSDLLLSLYEKKGVRIVTDAEITRISSGKVTISKPKKETISAEKIVVAVGRAPNTQSLQLEHAGIKTNQRGAILVDEYLQTSNKSVFAMGDCTQRPMFAHAAKREEATILNNLNHRTRKKMDFSKIPWAVFTNPPIAGVGLSERQAKEQYEVKTYTAPFTQNGRAYIMQQTDGFVKVIVNKRNGVVLGCVIIGPRADDLIHEYALLLNSSSPTIHTLRSTIHVHPTISEIMEEIQ